MVEIEKIHIHTKYFYNTYSRFFWEIYSFGNVCYFIPYIPGFSVKFIVLAIFKIQ